MEKFFKTKEIRKDIKMKAGDKVIITWTKNEYAVKAGDIGIIIKFYGDEIFDAIFNEIKQSFSIDNNKNRLVKFITLKDHRIKKLERILK